MNFRLILTFETLQICHFTNLCITNEKKTVLKTTHIKKPKIHCQDFKAAIFYTLRKWISKKVYNSELTPLL